MTNVSIIWRKYKKFSQSRLKILIFKPVYGGFFGAPFMHQDSIEALRELGHLINVADLEKIGSTPRERLNALFTEIVNFQPDFVLTFNFIGFVPPLLRLLSEMEIPHASWFVDNPWNYLNGKEGSSDTFLFVCDRMYIKRLKDCGFKRVYYLPGATNPRVFKRLKLSEEEERRFFSNLSFVGSSNYSRYKCYLEIIKDVNACRVLSEGVRIYSQNPSLETEDIIEEIEGLLPPFLRFAVSKESLRLLLEDATAVEYRKRILESVLDLGLHLYGDEGWKGLLGGRCRVFKPLDYYHELPKLYNATKINLSITSPGLKTTVNQRIFDVSACGSFVLSDYRRDLSELFRLGEEIICYRDRDELVELANYFLEHPEEREGIAKRAQARTLKEHTYKHRMNQLIEILRGLYK